MQIQELKFCTKFKHWTRSKIFVHESEIWFISTVVYYAYAYYAFIAVCSPFVHQWAYWFCSWVCNVHQFIGMHCIFVHQYTLYIYLSVCVVYLFIAVNCTFVPGCILGVQNAFVYDYTLFINGCTLFICSWLCNVHMFMGVLYTLIRGSALRV